MINSIKQHSTRLLIALVVISLVLAGPVGAASSVTISADDDSKNAQTTHRASLTAGYSGNLSQLQIAYDNGTDVQQVDATDVEVSVNGTAVDVSSVSTHNASSINVTLANNQSMNSGATDVDVNASDVINADNGSETATVQLYEGDTAADSGSASISLTATGYDAARSVGALTSFLTLDADGYNFSVLSTNISVFQNHFALAEDENVPFNGSENATVTYAFDGDAAERLSSSTEDTEAGEWDKSTIVMVSGEPVKAYVDEAPDDVENGSTYAIVDTTNNSVVVHPGSDYDGQSQLDSVTVDANRGWRASLSTYGVLEFTGVSNLMSGMVGGGDLLGAGLLAFGVLGTRRERGA
jgi:hypothetical protein